MVTSILCHSYPLAIFGNTQGKRRKKCGHMTKIASLQSLRHLWTNADIFLKILSFFLYFWLCWVFISVRGFSPVVPSGGHSSSQCAGLSPSWPLVTEHGSRRAGSVVVVHGLSCSVTCGIFPDQGSNSCPLHLQADSQPLHHQGSPADFFPSLSWW